MEENRIRKGNPYPLGATVVNNGINFSTVDMKKSGSGILLYPKDRTQKPIQIPFHKKSKIGNISCLQVRDITPDEYEYCFYNEDGVYVDPYAKRIIGNEVWGIKEEPELHAGFQNKEFDWEKTGPLHISYADSVMYCLHVRGFTKHKSSKVEHKGTFKGIIEKIPYLKELGINSIELMPAYEFEEYQVEDPQKHTMEYATAHLGDEIQEKETVQLNYWGYKNAFYFAPKASYAAGTDPCREFKEMVRELHKNGIEVIMQFYFPDNCKQGYILEVLKYWILEYMIDGIHLKGNRIPITLLATEPLFANTKLMYSDFPQDEIYPDHEMPVYKHLAFYRDEFMYDMRKYLKSDADMLKSLQFHMKNNPQKIASIHYISNYYGFTLADLVSYDRKHNEENGENNQDGNDYNYSWNCGIEGPSRRKAITLLRKKQMKNALMLVFFAQGTPLIMSGDEFCNSQKGNNNPYCQDNEISWLNWSQLQTEMGKSIFTFTKELIKLRKNHPILRREDEMRLMDTIGCGYPDLSYHSEEAWRAHLENYNRHLAFMYCGKYEKVNHQMEDDFFYVACNMYWEKIHFALPSLPAGYEWIPCMTSEDSKDIKVENARLESLKEENLKAETAVDENKKIENVKMDNKKPEVAKAENSKTEAIKIEASKIEVLKSENAKLETTKAAPQKQLEVSPRSICVLRGHKSGKLSVSKRRMNRK